MLLSAQNEAALYLFICVCVGGVMWDGGCVVSIIVIYSLACRPFSFPILVEGKGLVSLVSTTCANDIIGLLRYC